MIASESDSILRRLERNAIIVCLVAAVIVFAVGKGRLDLALGVLGGGVLVGASYWAIKSAVDALLSGAAHHGAARADASLVPHDDKESPRPTIRTTQLVWVLIKVAARYALLAGIAYVMMARLRLHPLGLLIGASSIVAAAAVEVIRTPKKN